jgi:hypothetical protein
MLSDLHLSIEQFYPQQLSALLWDKSDLEANQVSQLVDRLEFGDLRLAAASEWSSVNTASQSLNDEESQLQSQDSQKVKTEESE